MNTSDSGHDPIRRHALGMLGTGLAATPVLMSGSALAQTARPAGPGQAAKPESPARRPAPAADYPRPPFPPQQQPWPGLAQKMEPRPDHGETSYVGTGRLKGRRALITGGDSGIGRAAAIAYAREGADVAINYLPVEEPDAKDVIELIRAEGGKAVALPGDLRDEAFCKKLVRDAHARLGGLDVLVNNAARQQARKSILDISNEDFDATLKTNLYAMFWLTKAAVPLMPAGGSIINTASVVADDPPESLLDYSTTKGGIVVFTKGLAKQLAGKGIRVNAIAPGPYWTPLQPSGGQLPGNLTKFGADTPYGRPGQPVEIAPLFVLLASDEATYTSGNIFGSTGGRGNV